MVTISPAKVLGHRLLGQVVIGGAKAAGGQNQVTAGERLPQGGFQPFWVVPHHRLMVYFDAHLGQFCAKNAALVLTISPSSSSVPMHRISRFHIRQTPLFGETGILYDSQNLGIIQLFF